MVDKLNLKMRIHKGSNVRLEEDINATHNLEIISILKLNRFEWPEIL